MVTMKFQVFIDIDVAESVTKDEARRKVQDALREVERKNLDITINAVYPDED